MLVGEYRILVHFVPTGDRLRIWLLNQRAFILNQIRSMGLGQGNTAAATSVASRAIDQSMVQRSVNVQLFLV